MRRLSLTMRERLSCWPSRGNIGGVRPPSSFPFLIHFFNDHHHPFSEDPEPEPELPTEQVILTSNQKVIFEQLKEYFQESSQRTMRSPLDPLHFPTSLSGRERQFVLRVCEELCLSVDLGEGTRNPSHIFSDPPLLVLHNHLSSPVIKASDHKRVTVWYDHSADLMKIVPKQHFDEVIGKYKSAKIYVDEYEQVASDEKAEYDASFLEWKKAYYREKLEIDPDNSEGLLFVLPSFSVSHTRVTAFG